MKKLAKFQKLGKFKVAGKLTLKLRGVKTDDTIISKEKAADFRKWFDR